MGLLILLLLLVIFVVFLWLCLYCLKRILTIKSEKVITFLINLFAVFWILGFFTIFFEKNELFVFYLWIIKNDLGAILNAIVVILTAIVGVGFLFRKKQFYFLGLFIFGYSLSVFSVRLIYFIYLLFSKKYTSMETVELIRLGYVSFITVLIFSGIILFMIKYKKYFISKSSLDPADAKLSKNSG